MENSHRSVPSFPIRTSIVAVGLALSCVARTAAAQEGDVSAAAAAFSRAQEAEVRGEMAQAADLYELADRISPAPGALRSATRARMAASQLAAAAGDAEELKRRYPNDTASAAIADEVLVKAGKQLVRVTTNCTPSCTLIVDGLAASADSRQLHVLYVQPGPHTVVGRFGDGSSGSERIDGVAAQPVTVAIEKPAVTPATTTPATTPASTSTDVAPAPTSHGLTPVVGLVVTGAAVVLGGVAVWSGIDTNNARDDFEKNPTRAAFDAGEQKDTRTNILIGAAAAVGTAGVLILAFGTNWSGKGERPPTAALHLLAAPGTAGLSMRGSF